MYFKEDLLESAAALLLGQSSHDNDILNSGTTASDTYLLDRIFNVLNSNEENPLTVTPKICDNEENPEDDRCLNILSPTTYPQNSRLPIQDFKHNLMWLGDGGVPRTTLNGSKRDRTLLAARQRSSQKDEIKDVDNMSPQSWLSPEIRFPQNSISSPTTTRSSNGTILMELGKLCRSTETSPLSVSPSPPTSSRQISRSPSSLIVGPLAIDGRTHTQTSQFSSRSQSKKAPNKGWWRTELCKFYETAGGCRNGRSCRWAHGAKELRDCTSISRDTLINWDSTATRPPGSTYDACASPKSTNLLGMSASDLRRNTISHSDSLDTSTVTPPGKLDRASARSTEHSEFIRFCKCHQTITPSLGVMAQLWEKFGSDVRHIIGILRVLLKAWKPLVMDDKQIEDNEVCAMCYPSMKYMSELSSQNSHTYVCRGCAQSTTFVATQILTDPNNRGQTIYENLKAAAVPTLLEGNLRGTSQEVATQIRDFHRYTLTLRCMTYILITGPNVFNDIRNVNGSTDVVIDMLIDIMRNAHACIDVTIFLAAARCGCLLKLDEGAWMSRSNGSGGLVQPRYDVADDSLHHTAEIDILCSDSRRFEETLPDVVDSGGALIDRILDPQLNRGRCPSGPHVAAFLENSLLPSNLLSFLPPASQGGNVMPSSTSQEDDRNTFLWKQDHHN